MVKLEIFTKFRVIIKNIIEEALKHVRRLKRIKNMHWCEKVDDSL